MAIQVEPHQCPLHQSILPTQGPIHEIFTKIYLLRIGDFEKLSFFEIAIFNVFLLHFHENQSKVLGYQEWVEILMITLVSLPPNISAPSVVAILV